MVRPSNASINFALRECKRLVQGIRGPVVISAGNHDTPRMSETGDILLSLREVGVIITVRDAEQVEFENLSILAVPHAAMTNPELSLEPRGAGEYQVLMIHGDAADNPEGRYELAQPTLARIPEQLPASWNFIALGHYHVRKLVGDVAWYSGSLDYVSTNPWGEMVEERKLGLTGKGWNLVDLDAGTVEFVPVPATRRFIDFPRFSAEGLAGQDIMDRLNAAIAPANIEDAICRMVVTEIPAHLRRELDHGQIREWKAKAMHFNFDFRKPERQPSNLLATLFEDPIEDEGENLPEPVLEPGSIALKLDRNPAEWANLAEQLMELPEMEYGAAPAQTVAA